MKTKNCLRQNLLALALLGLCLPGSVIAANPPSGGLTWDAEVKEAQVEAGARQASFKFWFTNATPNEISIQSARSSCFCTVAKLPSEPWPIAAGSSGAIDVTMDLAGKRGTVTKPVNVVTSAGAKTLQVRVNIPYEAMPVGPTPAVAARKEEERAKNLQMALADRQVVFTKAECAECHAKPAAGRSSGTELYAAVCGNCHDSLNRASSVPDLHAKGAGQNLEYWRNWIAHGRAGTMMPAFAQSEGGPLSEGQLESLAEHLAMSVAANERPKAPGGLRIEPEVAVSQLSSVRK